MEEKVSKLDPMDDAKLTAATNDESFNEPALKMSSNDQTKTPKETIYLSFNQINANVNNNTSTSNQVKEQLFSILTLSSSSSSSSSTSSASSTTSTHEHRTIQSTTPVDSQCKLSSDISCASSSSNASSGLASTGVQHHQNNKYIFILNAFVNGFVQLKLCADKIDYEFIIEIYWSNETKTFVKRTFDDFVLFNRNLLQEFSQFFNDLKNNSIGGNCQQNKLKVKDSKFINVNGLINNINSGQLLMPVLPANKKPFWMSHLKLAESREIELNTYVQRVIKLPIKISHSSLVLQFFESQSSDPKPAKIKNFHSNNIENSESGTNSIEDDIDLDFDEEENENLHNTSSNNNDSNDDHNLVFNEGDEDEDDEDEFDYNDDAYDNFDEENNECTDDLSNCKFGLHPKNNKFSHNYISKKRAYNKEAGLWWDEDNALNELTTSISFDLSNQFHKQYVTSVTTNTTTSNTSNSDVNQNVNKNKLEENQYELETLKSLESLIKNSELFNEITENSASNKEICNNKEIFVRRLSLS